MTFLLFCICCLYFFEQSHKVFALVLSVIGIFVVLMTICYFSYAVCIFYAVLKGFRFGHECYWRFCFPDDLVLFCICCLYFFGRSFKVSALVMWLLFFCVAVVPRGKVFTLIMVVFTIIFSSWPRHPLHIVCSFDFIWATPKGFR